MINKRLEEEKKRPFIGVGILVYKQGKILIGESVSKKTGTVFRGVPGGHLENNEKIAACAKREVYEETNVIIDNVGLVSVYEFFNDERNRSYVTIGMRADWISNDPLDNVDTSSIRKNWKWMFPEDALKIGNLFPPDRVLIERSLSGIMYES